MAANQEDLVALMAANQENWVALKLQVDNLEIAKIQLEQRVEVLEGQVQSLLAQAEATTPSMRAIEDSWSVAAGSDAQASDRNRTVPQPPGFPHAAGSNYGVGAAFPSNFDFRGGTHLRLLQLPEDAIIFDVPGLVWHTRPPTKWDRATCLCCKNQKQFYVSKDDAHVCSKEHQTKIRQAIADGPWW